MKDNRHASGRRTIAVGISLGAMVGLAGCGDQRWDEDTAHVVAAIESENGLSGNGLALNGLTLNGLSGNGLSGNGLSGNGLSGNGLSGNGFAFYGLSSPGGLSSTYGLMTTDGGREIVKYMVKCALPAGQSFTASDQNGVSYTWPGAIGVAPAAIGTGTCDLDCQEALSACMLAHVNNSGAHIGIWLDGPDQGIGWGGSPNYPYQEGAFFGNLFAAGPTTSTQWKGQFCVGKNMAQGEVPGRLGAPIGTNSSVYVNPFGNGVACSYNCTVTNEGYTNCNDLDPNTPHPGGVHYWKHVVTVWRNFESTQMYRICQKNTSNCLGVVGGSTADGGNVEVRAYSGAPAQNWQILQVSGSNPARFMIVNVNSGLALTIPNTQGAQVTQKAYVAGTASQEFPISYFADQAGIANIKPNVWGTGMGAYAATNASGILVKTDSNLSTDTAKFYFTGVGLAPSGGTGGAGGSDGSGGTGGTGGSTLTFDPSRTYRLVPQNITSKSIDVCAGGQSAGTCVQQYGSQTGNANQAFYILAVGSSWQITMGANQNKCVVPSNNGTANNTAVVIGDCNGSSNQTYNAVSVSSGVYKFQNVASGRCLNVTGPSTADGARLQLYDCNIYGTNGQFAVQ